MKINLLFIACILLFGSCSRNIQVVQVTSPDVQLFDDDIFASENNDLAVAYDFWIEGGVMVFNVTNKTDEDITIDFTESTFKVNERIFYYYQDLYRYYDLSGFTIDPKQIEIAPQATETIEGFPVSYEWKPVKNISPTLYVSTNSPIQFENKLVYSYESDPNEAFLFENEFWVSSIEKLKRKEYKALNQNNSPKSDKFYVRRHQVETIDGPSFWLSVGIELLGLFLFL